jgi:hypothetical protein
MNARIVHGRAKILASRAQGRDGMVENAAEKQFSTAPAQLPGAAPQKPGLVISQKFSPPTELRAGRKSGRGKGPPKTRNGRK